MLVASTELDSSLLFMYVVCSVLFAITTCTCFTWVLSVVGFFSIAHPLQYGIIGNIKDLVNRLGQSTVL